MEAKIAINEQKFQDMQTTIDRLEQKIQQLNKVPNEQLTRQKDEKIISLERSLNIIQEYLFQQSVTTTIELVQDKEFTITIHPKEQTNTERLLESITPQTKFAIIKNNLKVKIGDKVTMYDVEQVDNHKYRVYNIV